MAFNLEITAQFSELFTQFNKVADLLKQIQLISRVASEQIQNDFKKSANGTAQLSDSSTKLLSTLLSFTSAIGGLDIGGVLKRDIGEFDKLKSGIKLTADEIINLSKSVLQEAAQFTDASDEKQAALQRESAILKQLQDAFSNNKNAENVKQLSDEIGAQINKVHLLTEEVKKVNIPPQQNPFEVTEKGVQALRNEMLKAKFDLDALFKKFPDGGIEVDKAKEKVKQLETAMKALTLSNSGISLTGGGDDEFQKKIEGSREFSAAIQQNIIHTNELADAAILGAAKFTNAEDQKQAELQQEVTILKDLKSEQAASNDIVQIKQLTAEIEKQTSVVKNLTGEIKKSVIPDQGDPFAKSTTGVISLRTQIQQARQAADLAANTYGEWSPQFASATQRLALLQNRLDQINKTAQAFNPEARLQGITNVIRGSLGGFNAMVAAMGLFGEETEDAQKALLKVQQLMLFTQGINEVLQLGTGFKALALQLGITQSSFSGAAAAQEAFQVSTAADSATITSGAKDLLKLATGQETVRTALDKLRGSKVADKIVTEAGTSAQAKAALTTELTVAAQRKQALSLAQVSAAARANAVSQAATAGATGTAGGAANVAAGAFARLWAVMVANPIIAILTSVVAIGAAILYFAEQTDEAARNQIKLNEAEKDGFKLLQELSELNNKAARDKIARSESDLKIAQAQAAAPEIILQKEIELDNQRRLLAISRIAELDLSEKKLGELDAAYRSSIDSLSDLKTQLRNDPGDDDLKERVEAQQGVVDNLKEQLETGTKLWEGYNNTVTSLAINTANLLKKTNENIFIEGKANLEAQIANAKAGSQEKTNDEIKLAENERNAKRVELDKQLNDINDARFERQQAGKEASENELANELANERLREQRIQAEILKLENETSQKINSIKTDAAIRLINIQKQIDEANLISIQKGSKEELDLRNKIIDENSKSELLKLQLTETEKDNIKTKSLDNLTSREKEAAAIIIRAKNEVNENIKAFEERKFEDEVALEKRFLLKRLAIVREGSKEEIELQKALIKNEEKLEIEQTQLRLNRLEDEKLLYAEIARIRAEANKKLNDIDKQQLIDEIDLALASLNAKLEIENQKLEAERDSPDTSEKRKNEINERILKNEKAIIQNSIDANKFKFDHLLIEEKEFIDKRNELQKEGAKNESDTLKNAAEEQKRLLREVIGLYSAAFKNMFPGASVEFEKLAADFEKLINKIKAGKLSLADGLQATGAILGNLSNLLSANMEAQIEALDVQHETIEQQLSDLDNLISEKENQIEHESELNEKGVANNLDLRKKELDELKKQKEEALKKDAEIKVKQQKLQKEQIAIDAITQASQLALAAAQILLGFSGIPFGIGIAIAAGVIAGMYAIFANAKAKSEALSQIKLGEGGDIKIEGEDYGKIKGKRHYQGGHNIEGTNLNVEDGEYLNHRKATQEYYHWLEGANKNHFGHIGWEDIVSLPGISFPGLEAMNQLQKVEINQKAISNITENKSQLRVLEISKSYISVNKGTEERIDTLTNELKSFKKKYFEKVERHIIPQPDGEYKEMIIDGNTTTVIKRK